MPILVLVRGLPGSGKTWYAKANFTSHGFKHLETDMFFTKNGIFRYETGKLPEAINWCQNQALAIMHQGEDLVISNHFTRNWEMGFYIEHADKLGYDIIIHTCLTEYEITKPYPSKLLDYMYSNFEH